MKKALVLLYLLAAIIVSGCGGMQHSEHEPSPEAGAESGAGQTTSPDYQKIIEVKLYQYKPEYKDAIEKAASEFNKDNQEIKIITNTIKEGEDYISNLKTLINSGNAPDLFNIVGLKEIFELKDKLEDLSDLEVAHFALDGTLKGATIDNKILGIPFNIEGFGFIYNKELFAQAQIDTRTIDTFDAFEDMVKELDKHKENLKIDAVFAFPAKDSQITGLHMSSAFISPEFEGDIAKTWQSKILEFKYSDAFKRMIDLQTKYSVQPVGEIDNKKMIEDYFIKNKVAIIQQGNWVYQMIELTDKEFAKKIDILPYPIEGYNENSNPVGVPMYWAVNSSSPQDVKDSAKKFLNWFYLSDAGKKVITENFKFVPAYEGFSADSVQDPLGKKIMSKTISGSVIPQVYMGYPARWGQERLGMDILRYTKKEMKWDEVVNNAKEAWAKARK